MDVPVNLFAGIPEKLPDELIQILHNAPGIRIERIVSHGRCSPEGFWYDQAMNEWVMVLQGRARIGFENEPPLELTAGSFVNMPAHKRHRVEWTDPAQPTIWLAIHYS